MTRITTALATLLVGLLLASCGGDDGEPIPGGRAERLEDLLQAAQRQSDAGACQTLRDTTIPRLEREARRLPDSVSADTRETIEDGVAHLSDLAETDCRDQEPEDETTSETTPPPTTPTLPPVTPTTPPTQEPPPTEEPTDTETEPEPPPPGPPDEPGNGNGNGGGDGNGGGGGGGNGNGGNSGGVGPGDGATGGVAPGRQKGDEGRKGGR